MRTQRRRSERGATLIETAIAVPVFLLMVFGVFEFGFLLRSHLTLDAGTAEAARAASVGGQRSQADFLVLHSLAHGLQEDQLPKVQRIVVFKADGPGAEVPRACLSVPLPENAPCNQYGPEHFFLPFADDDGVTNPAWGCGPTSFDRYWCPANRVTLVNADSEPDYVGVYVEMEHQYITGIVGRTKVVESTFISRLEPSES